MNKKLLAELVLLFLATQTLGIGTGYALQLFFAEQPGARPGIVSQNPEDAANSIGLIVWILLSTAALLIAIKYLKGKMLGVLLRVFEAFAVFGASWLVLSIVFGSYFGAIGDIISLGLALLLVASKNVFKENLMIRNVAGILATAGAGALIGTMLGILPVILFLVLLAVYDYIAVFKTKHMVTLAKAITKKNLAFTYALPTKEHKFELGTGDLVIPLVFAVSVLGESMQRLPHPILFLPSAIVLAASLAGLILTINYVSKRVGTAVPALPLQTAFMVIAFGATKLAGL